MKDERLGADLGSLLRSALEQSCLAAILIDENDQVIFFNGAAERLWGYKHDEAFKLNLQQLLPEFLCLHIHTDCWEDGLTDTETRHDILINQPNGKQQCLSISLSRIVISGRVYHMVFAYDASKEEDICQQNSMLLAAANHTDLPILVLDQDRNIVQVNRAFTENYGYEADEIIGQDPTTIFISPLMMKDEVNTFLGLPWGKSKIQAEAKITSKDGSESWIRISSSPIKEGAPARLIGHSVDVVCDVTEERLIRNLEHDVLEALVSNLSFSDMGSYLCQRVRESAPDVIPSILLVDSERKLRPWAASGLVAGYSEALDGVEIGENVGSCGTAAYRGEPVLVNDISTDPCWKDYRQLALSNGLQACWSFPVKRRDGIVACTFAFYFSTPRSPDIFHMRIAEACQHLCILAIELEENRRQMTRLVQFDTLTGLPNRSYLHHHVSELQTSGIESIAFIGLDFDRLKDVNSTLGYKVGDQVLVIIANRLQERLKPDEFLCRVESDFFFLVIANCDVYRATATAEYIQAIVGEPVEVAGHILNLTVSIGISHSKEGECDLETFLANAKSAIVEVKAAGGNSFKFFSPEMNQEAWQRLLLGVKLKRAITNGTFYLQYQPQVHSNGRLYGVEAMARWHDPELGEIPPEKFIRIAEETGDIEVIGRWVLREACRQMAEWQHQNVQVPRVSVNLSPYNFRNKDLPEFIASLLQEYSLTGTSLTIEITENLMMRLSPETLALLQRIRVLGVGLSVDDFGTGYSCLSNLANLPVTELKIDRSFIENSLQQPRLQSLVEAVLGIGRSLDLTVVAEGVETEEQRIMLGELGCPVMQGYLFSRPISAHHLTEWLLVWELRATRYKMVSQQDLAVSRNTKEIEQRLKKMKGQIAPCLPKLLYDVVGALPIAVSWATLPGGVIQYCNDAFYSMFDYPSGHFRMADQLIDEAYIHEHQRKLIRSHWNNFFSGDGEGTTAIPDTEIEIRTGNGEIRPVMHCGVILHEQQLAVAIFKDITEYKRDQQMLRNFAFLDPLTGLANRRGLTERWLEEHQHQVGGRRLAFLMVDLDGFKLINDTYGHDAGDQVLRVVAERLTESVREVDLVCRLGGDEFGIMMVAPNDFGIVAGICDRIVALLQQPISLGQVEVRITASIGGCFYPDQASDKHELLRRADEALLQVKKKDKGGWCWWEN